MNRPHYPLQLESNNYIMLPADRTMLAIFLCIGGMAIAGLTSLSIPDHTVIILLAAAGACGWFWPRPK